MALMQGDGKVRLIAKKGLYAENGTSARIRQLVKNDNNGRIVDDYDGKQHQSSLSEQIQNVLDSVNSNYYIEFQVTPDITESGSANYFEASDVRGPGSILMYMGSPSRTFSLNTKLVARNAAEAAYVSRQIHVLKSWRMPESYTGGFNAGSPTLLYLQGYGKMFKDIPVVMTDLSIEFSSEFDAISIGSEIITTDTRTKINAVGRDKTNKYTETVVSQSSKKYDSSVPIIVPVSITLKEAHSVEGEVDGLEGFDILKYRNGTLGGW